MRTSFDFAPLFRSLVGFDLLENADRVTAIANWPSYDIAKTDVDTYRITWRLQASRRTNWLLARRGGKFRPGGEEVGPQHSSL